MSSTCHIEAHQSAFLETVLLQNREMIPL